MNDTLKYYEDNAEKLIGSTAGVDFSRIQNSFLQLLPPGIQKFWISDADLDVIQSTFFKKVVM